MPPRVRPAATATREGERSIWAYALGDALATAFFVFVSSIFEELATMLAATLAPYVHLPPLAAGLTVLIGGLMLFDALLRALGGSGLLFNPAHNIAFAVAGHGSVRTNTTRAISQLMGGVAGAAAAIAFVPSPWQGKFSSLSAGLRPGVTLTAGVLCEAMLGFALNMTVLWSMGSGNKRLEYWSPLMVTVPLVAAGAELTGPSMNPAIAFSWFVHLRGHALAEHLAVFWAAPVVGALAAGWVWRALNRPSARKPSRRATAKAATRPQKKTTSVAAAKKAD